MVTKIRVGSMERVREIQKDNGLYKKGALEKKYLYLVEVCFNKVCRELEISCGSDRMVQ